MTVLAIMLYLLGAMLMLDLFYFGAMRWEPLPLPAALGIAAAWPAFVVAFALLRLRDFCFDRLS